MENFVLYEHQKSAIRKCIQNKRFALYHEQGLGKTISAILAADYVLSKADKNKHAIIVCPAFLQSNWQREIEKWSKFESCYRIFSYDTFWRLPTKVQLTRILIIDEAHYIKNRRAKRTEAVVDAANWAERVILLTGTPIGNRNILDLYTHLCCLDPTNRYTDHIEFRRKFMRLKTYKFQKDESQNEAEFLEILSQFSERKLKSECLDLPDKIYHEFSCKGTRVHAGLHVSHKMQAQDGFDFDVVDKSTGELVERIKSSTEKVYILRDLFDNIPFENQIVVYVSFRKSIEYIQKITWNSYESKAFHGDLTSQQKEKVLTDFKENKFRILIATMQSMNVGVTLTNCSEVIYYSRTFSCTERAQSEDRFHRIGQRNVVNYYDIIADGVDRKAFEMLKQNKSYDEIKKEIESA